MIKKEWDLFVDEELEAIKKHSIKNHTIIVDDIEKANNTQGVDASCKKIRCPVVQLEVRDTCPEEQGCPELAKPYPLDSSRVSATAAIVRFLVHV